MILPLALFTLLFAGGEKIVINEFSYDDSGTADDKEFVELYNPTATPIDISGWKLESNDELGTNTGYTIPANTVLAAGAYYVLGSALVPNVNQVIGTVDLWENSQESLVLKDGDGNIIDSLVYEANKGVWPGAKIEGDGVWGNLTNVEGRETSWSRLRDGFDTNNNRDFRLQPWSPGASNNLVPGVLVETFDTLTQGNPVTAFGGSYADVFVIDPTVVDLAGNNPNAIPASPQGGNAMICWDKSGGGNSNMLLLDPTCRVTIEAYVYFDAKLRPSGEREMWSIGQGTTGTFYNFPDPSGNSGFTANGNTGVSWTFEVTDTSATLYLIDHNDGGEGNGAKTDRKVLGSVVLSAGTNDGWQRLRLEIDGENVTGYFGGTLGGTNGVKVSGVQSSPAMGGVYIGYREGVSANGSARPFTCDALSILHTPDKTEVETHLGTCKATTVGTPRIGTNGCPLVGSTVFALTGIDFVPSSTTLWSFGLVSPPVDMTIIGGQMGSFLYVQPALVVNTSTPASGEVQLPVAIPNLPIFQGATIDIQAFDLDPALTETVKLGNSRVLHLQAY